MTQRNFGFSLVEMAMVLAISGLMIGYALKADQSSGSKDCYVSTKVQMVTIRTAIEQFARKNDRLPMPADLTFGVENPNYGHESGGNGATVKSSWGALPFQALGLAPSFAADCWGNKFTYVVSTILTTNATVNGYLDSSIIGRINLNNATGVVNTNTAYAIISHGENGSGAVKANATTVNWCTTNTALEAANCNPGPFVMDADFNNGKNAGNNYFDDLIITSGRPQVKPPPPPEGSAWGWGSNGLGQIGDSTVAMRTAPWATSGSLVFSHVSAGGNTSCGLTTGNVAYCWGGNGVGLVGDGTTIDRHVPTAVSMPGGVTFTQISAGTFTACGLSTTGAAYCWGINGFFNIGDGTSTDRTTATLVSGGHVFTQIGTGTATNCGIANDSTTYCWGMGTYGQIGNGAYATASTPTAVTVPGGVVFTKLSVRGSNACGLTAFGVAYCWGDNTYGQVAGDGTSGVGVYRNVATAVSAGGRTFSEISTGDTTCGVSSTAPVGALYCWGLNTSGQIGDGTKVNRYTPTAVSGGLAFKQVNVGLNVTCGLTTVGLGYCWGQNSTGQIGNKTVTAEYLTPTAIAYGHLYSQISTGMQTTLAVVAANSP